MNLDDELRDLQQGEARYFLNCRVNNSDDANQGDVENTKGNVIVSFTLPTGANKTIGAYENLIKNRIFYFVYNSLGNHGIYEFNSKANTITTILQSSILNFDLNHLITGINVIDNLLYWTDNLNEPMKIDVAKAKLPSTAGGYPTPFLVDYIYAIKPPQLCQPTVIYLTDKAKNFNYLKNKLFQFSSRYIYDNNEKSVLSPISEIPLPGSGSGNCNPLPYSDNYIEVEVETGNEIVTDIEIAAREGNGSNPIGGGTDFYTIAILNKKELSILSNSTYKFKFYNDKNYVSLDVTRAIQLYDYVPTAAKAQEMVDGNRIVYGNIEEGFDPIDIKSKINIDFEPNVVINTISIKGRIFVGNPFVEDYSCAYVQPIHDHGGNGANPCFGGFDYQLGSTVFYPNVGSSYKQELPLAGFVAYLAGTNYYGVSVQNNSNLPISNQNAFNTAHNVLAANTNSERDDIITEIQKFPSTAGTKIYSIYTINNIIEGSYLLRFASHKTTQADLNNNTLDYQRTSTYTHTVGGVRGHEVKIDFKMVNGQPEVYVNNVLRPVVNGMVDMTIGGYQSYGYGDSWICDLSAPNYEVFGDDLSDTTVFDGYVVDKDNSFTTWQNTLNDTRIHLAKFYFAFIPYNKKNLNFSNINGFGNLSYVTNDWESVIGDANTYTDHNGFWFIGLDKDTTNGVDIQPKILSGTTGGNSPVVINYGDTFYNASGATTTIKFDNSGYATTNYIIQNTSPSTGLTSVQEHSRTVITGKILDNVGNPANGINVQITNGGSGVTDANGEFKIKAYGDHTLFLYPNATGQNRYGLVLYSLGGISCNGTFTNYYTPFSFTLPPFNDLVSNPTWLVLPSPCTIVTLIKYNAVSLKRGATYEYGIVYYDHGIRSGTTQTKDYLTTDTAHNYGMKLYVPFYTDYIPATTTIYDSAKPVVSWAIANNPPSWATHYQWVRSTRGSVGFFIQWTLQYVSYINDYGAITSSALATQISISVESIIGLATNGYASQHKNSILNYSFVQGDRIRFIKRAGGLDFPQYFDLEIKGVDPTNKLRLVIPNDTLMGQLGPGDLVEIYRPNFGNIKVDEIIFYEIDECYEIGNPGLPTAYHKQGANVPNSAISNYKIQDQSINKSWSYFAAFPSNQTISYGITTYTNPLELQGTTAHNYNIGDVIMIEQSSGYEPTLSNSATVIAVPNGFQIIVDIIYNSAITPYSKIGGTVYLPATGIFKTGDTYYKLRNIPYDATNTLPPAATISNSRKLWYIEDPNYSDFYLSGYYSYGRPNKVDKLYKKIRRPTTIYFSGQYIPETNINDLNNIYDITFETYEQYYGSIQKLHNYNRMLDCYQELKVGRIPISQKIWKDTTGASTISVTNDVLNPIDYYEGEYGIGTNPESFTYYGYRRYFLDANRGVFCRLSSDGLTPISEHNFKAHNFFTDQCKLLTSTGLPFHVYTVYDQKFTECIIAFEELSYMQRVDFDPIKIDDGPQEEDIFGKFIGVKKGIAAKTIAFNEDENSWGTFYSYSPDFMISNNTDIVTFKGGELWKHNENPIYNNFYGVQYTSDIWFIVNGEPSKEKVFQAISFEDADAWDVTAECPNGMRTTLTSADFELIKNMRYAAFLSDINTPNTFNLPNFNPRINGQKMQDYVMLVKLQTSKTTFQKLFAVNVLWTPAERSNK